MYACTDGLIAPFSSRAARNLASNISVAEYMYVYVYVYVCMCVCMYLCM
jgi:hypothetical protein